MVLSFTFFEKKIKLCSLLMLCELEFMFAFLSIGNCVSPGEMGTNVYILPGTDDQRNNFLQLSGSFTVFFFSQ